MHPLPIDSGHGRPNASLSLYLEAALAAGGADAVVAALRDVPEPMGFHEVERALQDVGLQLVPRRYGG